MAGTAICSDARRLERAGARDLRGPVSQTVRRNSVWRQQRGRDPLGSRRGTRPPYKEPFRATSGGT